MENNIEYGLKRIILKGFNCRKDAETIVNILNKNDYKHIYIYGISYYECWIHLHEENR